MDFRRNAGFAGLELRQTRFYSEKLNFSTHLFFSSTKHVKLTNNHTNSIFRPPLLSYYFFESQHWFLPFQLLTVSLRQKMQKFQNSGFLILLINYIVPDTNLLSWLPANGRKMPGTLCPGVSIARVKVTLQKVETY